MATDEKATAEDDEGKAPGLHRHTFNRWRPEPLPALEAWEHVEDAAKAFRAAQTRDPGDPQAETLEGLRLVLKLLAVDDSFREDTIAAARKVGKPKIPGNPQKRHRREQERRFLDVLADAIRRFPDHDDMIAAFALAALPRLPALYAECEHALPGKVVDREIAVVRIVEYSLDATSEELRTAVKDLAPVVTRERTLNMINDRADGLVAIARAIVRHLGCDETTANNLFRIKRD